MDDLTTPRPDPHSERLVLFVLLPLTIVLVLVIAFGYFYYTTATVNGNSMYPGLRDRDYVIVAASYDSPVRGDVIVFSQARAGDREELVKRVVAVPGDVVEVRAGVAIVNGFSEPEHYEVVLDSGDISILPYTVPAGHVFVLGDNRPLSVDSRFFGAVPMGDVIGRVVLVVWPLEHFGVVDAGRGTD